MPPDPHPVHRRAAALPVLVAAAALAFGGCSASAAPSFDVAAPCTSTAGDGQAPGTFPALEAVLPVAYEGTAPSSLDSGRSCSTTALGTLAGRGVVELHFAGATWGLGGTTGLTVAVFESDGLDADAMIEFYEAGAAAARRTEKLATSDTTVAGVDARRLDVLGSDGTGQTVVAWDAPERGRVYVLLAADLGDARVAEALAVFGSELLR